MPLEDFEVIDEDASDSENAEILGVSSAIPSESGVFTAPGWEPAAAEFLLIPGEVLTTQITNLITTDDVLTSHLTDKGHDIGDFPFQYHDNCPLPLAGGHPFGTGVEDFCPFAVGGAHNHDDLPAFHRDFQGHEKF